MPRLIARTVQSITNAAAARLDANFAAPDEADIIPGATKILKDALKEIAAIDVDELRAREDAAVASDPEPPEPPPPAKKPAPKK